MNLLFFLIMIWQTFGGTLTLPFYLTGMLVHRLGNDRVKSSTFVRWLLSWDWGWIARTGHVMVNTSLQPHPEIQPLTDRGYVLANHRSFTDFFTDSYLSNSTVIARGMVLVVCLFVGIQKWVEGRIVFIQRGKSTAASVAAQMIRTMERPQNPIARYIFYPEGTRRQYPTLSGPDELLGYFRKGLLLTLYQHEHKKPRADQFPFQIQICMNKELVMNEKKLECTRGVELPYTRGPPLYAADHATDDLFLRAVAEEWFRQYVLLGGVVEPVVG
jgi:hypothetical protein